MHYQRIQNSWIDASEYFTNIPFVGDIIEQIDILSFSYNDKMRIDTFVSTGIQLNGLPSSTNYWSLNVPPTSYCKICDSFSAI